MKTSLYLNYPSRALLRGGQRTILAIFCVAVGVMAVVDLQLVGFMLQNSFTTNVRVLNGGDVSVTASGSRHLNHLPVSDGPVSGPRTLHIDCGERVSGECQFHAGSTRGVNEFH